MLPLPAAAKTRTGMNHVADLESEQWCHLMLWYLVLNDQTHHPVLSPTFSVAEQSFLSACSLVSQVQSVIVVLKVI